MEVVKIAISSSSHSPFGNQDTLASNTRWPSTIHIHYSPFPPRQTQSNPVKPIRNPQSAIPTTPSLQSAMPQQVVVPFRDTTRFHLIPPISTWFHLIPLPTPGGHAHEHPELELPMRRPQNVTMSLKIEQIAEEALALPSEARRYVPAEPHFP
jgi:hypothetical protein